MYKKASHVFTEQLKEKQIPKSFCLLRVASCKQCLIYSRNISISQVFVKFFSLLWKATIWEHMKKIGKITLLFAKWSLLLVSNFFHTLTSDFPLKSCTISLCITSIIRQFYDLSNFWRIWETLWFLQDVWTLNMAQNYLHLLGEPQKGVFSIDETFFACQFYGERTL